MQYLTQKEYYESLSKTDIFTQPQNYPWNCLLYYCQFTQDELVNVKPWIDIINMVKYQTCLTRRFVHEHFQNVVDNDDLLTWEAVYSYVKVE
jgi:hypothetical protein